MIVGEVFGLQVTADTPLLTSGLDSLSAIRIASALTRLGFPRLDAATILEAHTIIDIEKAVDASGTPITPLARYRQLAPTAGVHVSPLQLGAMSIGDAWQGIGMGAMDKEGSFKLLDAYYEAGGNFIDTANV